MALVLLMGVPGAGKTTLAKQLSRALGNDAAIVSFDDLFGYSSAYGKSVYGSMLSMYGFDAYSCCAHTERKACEAILRNALKSLSKSGRFMVPPYESVLWSPPPSFVIVDDIFYLKSMRRPLERMARANRLAYAVVFVDTPLEMALQRNADRPANAVIPEGTVRKISELVELPADNAEMFFRFSPGDSVEELAKNVKEFCVRDATMRSAAEKPAVNDSEPARNQDDRWQRLESDLRSAMGELMRRAGADSGSLAKTLSKAKRDVAAEMRAEDCREWTSEDIRRRLNSRIVNVAMAKEDDCVSGSPTVSA